jgi:hypothetical protein
LLRLDAISRLVAVSPVFATASLVGFSILAAFDSGVLQVPQFEAGSHGRVGLVEVVVELERAGRDDVALEQAVSRLSLEPSVTSVRWEVVDSPAAALSA